MIYWVFNQHEYFIGEATLTEIEVLIYIMS